MTCNYKSGGDDGGSAVKRGRRDEGGHSLVEDHNSG